jgi:alcohol dehydrogenase
MQRFQIESNVLYGIDAGSALPSYLLSQRFQQPAVLVDAAVRAQPGVSALVNALRVEGLEPVLVHESDAAREPTYAYLDETASRFRAVDFDVLIGIGGGSVLDLAKGVAILRTNSGRGVDYRGVDRVGVPGIPVVLIPTTAGTGSEATRTASFIDHESQIKLGINGRHVGCVLAVLDPAFTVSCPRSPTIAAGLDALVHAVEAVTTRTATPVSTLFGIEAVRLMFAGLSGSVRTPQDLGSRADALLGSHYAGLAMWNAGGGPASGISYPLGVHWAVPHGWAGGLLLHHVVSMNVSAGYVDGYARIYTGLAGVEAAGMNAASRAQAFVDRLFALYEGIGAPNTFREFGVRRDDARRLTALTLDQRKASLDLNPVPFGESDVATLLERVLD